jgi:hypothetical protein
MCGLFVFWEDSGRGQGTTELLRLMPAHTTKPILPVYFCLTPRPTRIADFVGSEFLRQSLNFGPKQQLRFVELIPEALEVDSTFCTTIRRGLTPRCSR